MDFFPREVSGSAMAFVNFATREITAKIVYYGPGLGGKTTSLQCIHSSLPQDNRGKMTSLATEEDRTIYFDFLPLHLGKIQEFAVRVQLYTVPGQVRYNATRKLVLRGADGLVFVLDSQKHKKLANLESFSNLEENLREHGKDLRDLPHVLQMNKVDLPNIMPSEDLNVLLNKYNVPHFGTCATTGTGILEGLKSITKLVFNDLGRKALLQKKTRTSVTPATVTVTAQPAPAQAIAAAKDSPASGSSYFRSGEFHQQEMKGDAILHEIRSEYAHLDQEEGSPLPEENQESAHETEALTDPMDLHDSVQEVEPIPEFEGEEELPQDEIPYENLVAEDEKNYDPNMESFSYAKFFDDSGKFRELMLSFEMQITENDTEAAMLTAKAVYSLLTAELSPKEYILSGDDSSIMLALNIKFKRFLRFKHLIDSERVQTSDLLFIHHFFCDLYLSLKEF